jgi:4-azaleucine resistance transporter AzlC
MTNTDRPEDGGAAAPAARTSVTFSAGGVRRGFLRFAALTPFVIPFGIAYGAAAVEAGFTAAQAVTMSALVFAGASQFAVLEVWADPVPWIAVLTLAATVNARFFVMSAALARWANALPPGRRFLALCTLADANFADTHGAMRAGERDMGILLGGGLAQWWAWVVGTALGAYAGAAMGALERYGADVVLPCFFIALVAAGLRERVNWAPAAVGAVVAVATMEALPAGWGVIAGALAGGAAAALRP